VRKNQSAWQFIWLLFYRFYVGAKYLIALSSHFIALVGRFFITQMYWIASIGGEVLFVVEHGGDIWWRE
jgi:hypothetical protein